MTRRMNSMLKRFSVFAMLVAALGFYSGEDKIDESNMYTFTGESIYSYLKSSTDYTDFAYLRDQALNARSGGNAIRDLRPILYHSSDRSGMVLHNTSFSPQLPVINLFINPFINLRAYYEIKIP